jgi:hypothetical protein
MIQKRGRGCTEAPGGKDDNKIVIVFPLFCGQVFLFSLPFSFEKPCRQQSPLGGAPHLQVTKQELAVL